MKNVVISDLMGTLVEATHVINHDNSGYLKKGLTII